MPMFISSNHLYLLIITLYVVLSSSVNSVPALMFIVPTLNKAFIRYSYSLFITISEHAIKMFSSYHPQIIGWKKKNNNWHTPKGKSVICLNELMQWNQLVYTLHILTIFDYMRTCCTHSGILTKMRFPRSTIPVNATFVLLITSACQRNMFFRRRSGRQL